LTAEVESCILINENKVNEDVYGSSDVTAILNGEAKVSDEALITKLHGAITKAAGDNAAIDEKEATREKETIDEDEVFDA
jgi:hypothetical protein